MTIESALQTRDGGWRVEIIRRGRGHWYRILHGDNVIDWLGIAGVERILGEAGVDMAQLVEVTDDPPPRQSAARLRCQPVPSWSEYTFRWPTRHFLLNQCS